MALLDLQGMQPSAPESNHDHGGHGVESSASLLVCLASSLSLVTCD